MKPIIILPPDTVSTEDIKLLNDNDLCVVEAKDPAAVRFVDPLPAQSSRTEIENAAIQLSRRLLHWQGISDDGRYVTRDRIAIMFAELLSKGTPLQAGPTEEELADRERRAAKMEEARRLGRAEAKAEREAAKKAEGEKKKLDGKKVSA